MNTADEYGETPLTLACSTGDAALISKLLKAGADAKAESAAVGVGMKPISR